MGVVSRKARFGPPPNLRGVVRDLGGNGLALLGLLLMAPLGALLLLRAIPALDLVLESLTFHVVAVSAIAAFSLFVALVTGVVAVRGRQPATFFLALGCLFVGIFMLGHGLTTPGIGGRPMNTWVGRFPVLAIAGFATCLAAAAAPHGSSLRRLAARFPWPAGAAVTLATAAGTALVVVRPTALAGDAPVPGEHLVTHFVIGAAAVALLVTGAVHWRRWRLGRDRVQLGLVAACWLSVDAVISLELGHMWRISWWDYHAYLLAAFGISAWALLRESGRGRSIHRALATVSISDPMEHIARGYPETLNALVAAVEAKDHYTHGHSSRVADLSIRLGLRLGLGPGALRTLAQGAYLHDIGKIGVPDSVLNKPGSLTDEEWVWIEAHPVVGWQVAGKAPSLRDALSVIRHHHERWDGSGYPDHLSGRDIPMAARIASVADVWDALTSDRSYRPAWPLDRALAHIVEGRKALFDPLVVEALIDLAGQRGLWPERTDAELDVLAHAAQDCHRTILRGAQVRQPSAQPL
jgi:HD-GYP domain-containing protein (c-di-GMP phosphodiesterase class II)